MTLQKLASMIAKREGKKSQARIGDIREILKSIVDMQAELYMEQGDIINGPFNCLDDYLEKKITALKKKRLKNTQPG